MPHVRVYFHRLAAKEYRGARRWYAKRSTGLAESFKQEIDRAAERIAEGPEQWPIFRKKYRWVKTHRFPFLLYFYVLNDSEVLVMAVAHASRRLGYWLRRSPLGWRPQGLDHE